jgi:tetratricopeptide (TPR) repeat protein
MPDPAVLRVLARDDLLMVAQDAEKAVGIVPKSKSYERESELFSAALIEQCSTARSTNSDGLRLDALTNAGVIYRLGRQLGVRVVGPPGTDLDTLHDRVLDLLDLAKQTKAGEELDGDLYRGRTVRYPAIRDLRLRKAYEAALSGSEERDRVFVGTGVDMSRAAFNFERAATRILTGEHATALDELYAAESGYWKAVASSRFASRYRVHYAVALAAWAGGDLGLAERRLTQAKDYLWRVARRDPDYEIDNLLLSLAMADLLIVRDDRRAATVNRAVDHLDEALRVADRVRDRWRVISRSRCPLSATFRRVHGDLARAAAMLPGRQAAELGLRAALAAKQSGFAGRMRAESSHVDDKWQIRRGGRSLGKLIERAVRVESDEQIPDKDGALESVRLQILEAVSPMLADTLLPVPANVGRVVDAVAGHYALDYVGLPDTVTGETTWFCTLIEPSGALSFHRVTVDPAFDGFLAEAAKTRRPPVGADWGALAGLLLPERLRRKLAAATDDQPLELIVSPHGALSLMPWGALPVDGENPLVRRAIVTQTPVLTCLRGDPTGTVAGPALIRLVAGSEGVGVGREQKRWGIDAEPDGAVPLSECAIEPESTPESVPGTLADALDAQQIRWSFLHVAAHGEGDGLAQTLKLPDGPISAGRALTLHWPLSTLMASCHVGRLVDIEHAEPLNLVMAVLAGGSTCVVAATDEVNQIRAGAVAADIVQVVRQERISLAAALREAQLRCIAREWPATQWARFVAYQR